MADVCYGLCSFYGPYLFTWFISRTGGPLSSTVVLMDVMFESIWELPQDRSSVLTETSLRFSSELKVEAGKDCSEEVRVVGLLLFLDEELKSFIIRDKEYFVTCFMFV